MDVKNQTIVKLRERKSLLKTLLMPFNYGSREEMYLTEKEWQEELDTINIEISKRNKYLAGENLNKNKDRYLICLTKRSGHQESFSTNNKIEAEDKYNVWKALGFITLSELNEINKYTCKKSDGELPIRSKRIKEIQIKQVKGTE